MPSYVLRIDDREGYRNIITSYANESEGAFKMFKRFSKFIVCIHSGKTGENTHYHFAIVTDYKLQALRAQLKLIFDKGKGNGHMSLKSWDDNPKAISYMFHEGEDCIVVNKGFTPKEIEDAKTVCKDIKEAVKANSPNNICKVIVDKLLEKNIDSNNKRMICFHIWDHLQEKGDWFPNKFQLERWISMIQCLMVQCSSNPDANWKALKERWYLDFFEYR